MVFSSFALASKRGPEVVSEEERDLYLCHVKYHSGEEYVLKPYLPLGFSCLDCFRLSFHHKFKTLASAKRAAKVFMSRMGRDVLTIPSTYVENGYKIISHYQLCLI